MSVRPSTVSISFLYVFVERLIENRFFLIRKEKTRKSKLNNETQTENRIKRISVLLVKNVKPLSNVNYGINYAHAFSATSKLT